MKKILLLLTAILFVLNTNAQSYGKYIKEGKYYLAKKKYLTALERFDLAYELAKTNTEKDNSKTWKNKSRVKIREQQADLKQALVEAKQAKQESDSLLKLAKTEKQKAQKALAEADSMRQIAIEEKQNAEMANATNNKIIKTMYWIGGNLAITVDEYGRYGFIDKKGNVVIEPVYQKIISLNYNGAALMQNKINILNRITKKNKFLINGKSKEYIYTRKKQKIDKNTTALDLTPFVLFNRLFLINIRKITKLKELEIIHAKGCKIKRLPPKIKNLTNLKRLNLRANYFLET